MKYFQRLRDLREDFEMTQKEIAILLHTTQPQYARYETGEREMPIHHFLTLAKYYNISLDYLTGLINTPKTLDGKTFSFGQNKKL